MSKLSEIELKVHKIISDRIEVLINSKSELILSVDIKTGEERDNLEFYAMNNEEIFMGLPYKFVFNYPNSKMYQCVVKVWCDDYTNMMDTLYFEGYEPVERIGDTDFIICNKVGKKLDTVKVIGREDKILKSTSF